MNISLQWKKLLIIHACSPNKAFIFQEIKRQGITIICMHTEKWSRIIPYVDEWIITNVYNHEEAIL